MAYISRAGTPINTTTYENSEAAIAAFIAPAYAGAPVGEIEKTGDNTFRSMGVNYTIETGDNPKEARREARAAAASSSKRSAFNSRGEFRGSLWLSREMDRADSDF